MYTIAALAIAAVVIGAVLGFLVAFFDIGSNGKLIPPYTEETKASSNTKATAPSENK